MSYDVTDAFVSNVVVTLKEGVLFEVKPSDDLDENKHASFSKLGWITDKARLFVEALYATRENDSYSLDWDSVFKKIIINFYYKNFINNFSSQKNFFIMTFGGNVSIEVLSLLTLMEQTYPFLKLRRLEAYKQNKVDNELTFQTSTAMQKSTLLSSTLCLLVGTNTRYEGSSLNLNLRQRYLKGNFSILTLGSIIDLTIPTNFLGSNFKTIKALSEGNNIYCLELVNAKHPLLIYNKELTKRNDVEGIMSLFKILKYSNIITKTWNGLNLLNSNINDVGINMLGNFFPISVADLKNFNGIYIVETQNSQSIPNLKKLADLKLLNSNWVNYNKTDIPSHKIFFKQSILNQTSFKLPNSVIFEDSETFVNTLGFIKRIPKLINSTKNSKGNWQIMRKFFMNFCAISEINQKNNLFFNCKNLFNFRNYINFQYYSTQNLTSLNFFLNYNNQYFENYKNNSFKYSSKKLFNTKIKYWLDDFFSGGKDGYTQNSLTINRCSKLTRLERSNFF
jgi:hypothetical protein